MGQEGAPAGLVLLGALDDAENLAIALGVDRDRDQQGNGFLHRTLPPSIALDDRCLECLLAQLWNLQRHRAGLGLQLAIVAPRALVAPGGRPLVALCVAQPIRLRFQHRVQRLLDSTPNDVPQVLAHPIVVDPDHVA